MNIAFLVSSSTDPYWNIAVENYLVSLPDEGTVYLYLWRNRRTVVIGQNQNPYSECDLAALAADGGALVRRTTGGGAVYHDDGNVNFSFVAPYGLYDQQRHFAVISRALQRFGLVAEVSGRNDMLCDGRKFSGNAFSKGRCQRLHHGTLLIAGNMDDLARYLKVRPSKLHKHGVQSVRNRVVNLSELNPEISAESITPSLLAAFEAVYGMEATRLDFSDFMSQPDVVALHDRYCSDEWLYGKWRGFTATRSAQFDWGGVELYLSVDEEKGVVAAVEMSTDALDVAIVDEVRKILEGASLYEVPSVDSSRPDASMLRDVVGLVYERS